MSAADGDELTSAERPAEIRDELISFAEGALRRSPVAAAVIRAAANDASSTAVLGAAAVTQRRGVLLLAAIHHLLLGGAEHPLGRCFPTVTALPDAVELAGPRTVAFVASHREELTRLLATRATQTNEVGRCSAIAPALSAVTATVNEPLALVELGASAGLNLLVDRYRIRYEDGPILGPHDAGLILRAGWRGTPPPLRPATIAQRIGVDLHPIDVTDEIESRWLLACVWTDDVARFRQLQDALAIARSDPPPVRRGDLVEAARPLVEEIPSDLHPVVLTSWVLTYLSPAQRGTFVATLDDLGHRRDLSWVSIEQRDHAPGLPYDPRPRHVPEATEVTLIAHRGGRRAVTRLAEMHPHGYWVDWQA